jgi:D-tyrosyl-tRNA(Tyr) deacylase
MRVLLQRVQRGLVQVEGRVTGSVERGYVLLVGVTHGDGEAEAHRLAEKVAHLRVFEDEAGKMNLSLLDVGGGALVVSQFTLYANARRGRRPDFIAAAPPAVAEPLVARFADALRDLGVRPVEEGVFGAHMLVEILNDGPVTILLDTAEL